MVNFVGSFIAEPSLAYGRRFDAHRGITMLVGAPLVAIVEGVINGLACLIIHPIAISTFPDHRGGSLITRQLEGFVAV